MPTDVMDKKQQTIDTYNATAERMARKFINLGSYVDVAAVFALVQKKNPVVLEIGCGNGRDAVEICKYTSHYSGIDIAEKFIEIARKSVPQGTFEVADVETYEFPQGLDIVCAFASLIHVPKESFTQIVNRIYDALNLKGLLRISVKHSDIYNEVTKEDEFGVRTYYLYSQEDIERMAKRYSILKNELYDLRGQTWIEILLQKA